MKAPALLVAIPLLLGVLCGASLTVSPSVVVAATAVAWAVCACAMWFGMRAVFVAAACAGFFNAGAAIGERAQRESERPTLLAWRQQHTTATPVRVTGVLRADATTNASGVGVAIDVTAVDGYPVSGGARLSILGALAPAAADAWRGGRTVTTTASLHEPIDYRDPGVAGDRDRLARQGISLVGSVKSAALVTVIARGGTLSEAAAVLRAYVRTATQVTVGRWSPASAGVVRAILIGDRSALDAEDERRLQEAGTYHVIAISGGNIALLTALLVLCGRAVRLPARATAAAAIGVLAFYGYAAGLAPSVLRATIAGMAYLAARASDHRGPALNAVAVAAAIALVLEPLTILDPGFILSFGATLAIIIAAARIYTPDAPSRNSRSDSRLQRWRKAICRAALLLGAATLAAELALAPIGARLFGRISLAGLLLNFVAIPLMSAIQVAGLAAVTTAWISNSLGAAFGFIAHLATIALLRSATLVDVAPWLVIDLPPPAWPLVAAWYGGGAGLLFARRLRPQLTSVLVMTASALAMVAGRPLTRATAVTPPPAGWMRVAFLDVGQGDATLVRLPNGQTILVDAGGVPGTTFDLGRRVTLPAAWAFGATRLNALVLTHGDPDHIGGAPPLLAALAPREIWEGIPVPTHAPLQRLQTRAHEAGIPWIAVQRGVIRNYGDVTVRVLHPPAPDWERRRVRNDDSIVLELRLGDVAFVLPGDITQAVEHDAVESFETAPTVIVKAPHHGSAGSSSRPFIDALHPAIVVFSAGQRNPFGHPAPAVADRYRVAGARAFSTAEDGAIVIDTDGREVIAWCPTTGRRESLRPEVHNR